MFAGVILEASNLWLRQARTMKFFISPSAPFLSNSSMPFKAPFAGVDCRTAWLRGTLLIACLLGLFISHPVWSNTRAFPLLPWFSGFPTLPSPLDKILFGALLLSLLLAFWFYRPAVMFFLAASLYAFFEDQNRGQPWMYMYWVMLLLTLMPEYAAIPACRVAISVAYVWSGVQKLQPAFFNRVPGFFAAPAAHRWHLPGFFVDLLQFCIACAPFIEMFIGFGLWLPRFRKPALLATAAVHLSALLLLGPLGYNYNQVIWPWNVAMIALILILFPAETPAFRSTLAQLRQSPTAATVIALYACLPLLSYVGWWDSYFSFTLYAENQAKADFFITLAFADRLPPKIRAHVHALRQAYDPQIQGPFVLDIQGWAMREMHVPPLSETRSYTSVFRFLRQYSRSSEDLRMIISPRSGPNMFYQGDLRQTLSQ